MNKSTLATAVLLTLGAAGASLSAQASLTTSTTLHFAAGSSYCTAYNSKSKCIATDVTGTYFSMDTNGDGTTQGSEKTAFAPGTQNGVHIGTLQSVGQIDATWSFFSAPGNVYTTAPVVEVGTHTGNTAVLDFTGWTVNWGTVPLIPMGGDPTNYPTDTGLATITCSTVSCSNSSTFTLDYAAHVPKGDPSGFGGVYYQVHMGLNTVTGIASHVETVPVPAAVWLLGSGLLGLVGVARRKKKAQA